MNKEKANDRQIGGEHYQGQDTQHWDYAYARGFDCYQYIITKWVERWRDKGGVQDLRKAGHAIQKYIEVAEAEEAQRQGVKAGMKPLMGELPEEGDAGPEYVDQ